MVFPMIRTRSIAGVINRLLTKSAKGTPSARRPPWRKVSPNIRAMTGPGDKPLIIPRVINSIDDMLWGLKVIPFSRNTRYSQYAVTQ